MKTTSHTPGPWIKEGATICQANSNQTICKAIGKDEAIQSANAKLIVSAPDLLEALRFLLADYIAIQGDKLTGSSVPIEMAQAAILKAEGNQ